MLKINEYFDGAVKSIGFESVSGRASVGVMAPGEYEFGTSTHETMKVVSGELMVKLPGQHNWHSYKDNDVFEVEKNTVFHLRVSFNTVYICYYN